jgi:thymidylate synthase
MIPSKARFDTNRNNTKIMLTIPYTKAPAKPLRSKIKNGTLRDMRYETLIHTEGQVIINPDGDIAVTTLWSKPKIKVTNPRIAVVGSLYGAGIDVLLRNLAYNPQIIALYYTGKDRGSSLETLKKAWKQELDLPKELMEVTKNVVFSPLPDPIILPKRTQTGARQTFLPTQPTNNLPSDIFCHSIKADKPVQVWQGLLQEVLRYGQVTQLRKGKRRELLNVSATIRHPTCEVSEYTESMFNKELDADQDYTYGNRINSYFGFSFLDKAIELVKEDSETRKAYFTLWDNAQVQQSCPCLVSLFFRKHKERLSLTAAFRTHNLLDAWLPNANAIAAIQKNVCDRVGVPPGFLTIFSHSLTIDPANEGEHRAKISIKKNTRVDLDDRGFFNIRVDKDQCVAEHFHEATLLGVYRAKNADQLCSKIKHLIGSVSHALYIGKEIGKICCSK